MMDYIDKILQSSNYIKEIIDYKPEVAIILGSGLGCIANEVKDKIVIKYESIPNFPKSTVEGHAGEFVFGELEGKKLS